MAKEVKKQKEILNKDLLRFRKGFENLADVEAHIGFTFKIVKNLRLVEAEIEIFDELIKPTDEYKEKYQKPFEEIAKQHCEKDKGGNPIVRKHEQTGNSYYSFISEEKEIFNEKVKALEEDKDVKPIVEKRKKQIEKYEQLLEKPSTVKFFKIPESELPSKMTPAQLNMIFELVE